MHRIAVRRQIIRHGRRPEFCRPFFTTLPSAERILSEVIVQTQPDHWMGQATVPAGITVLQKRQKNNLKKKNVYFGNFEMKLN
jgi:hypothetical protein